MIRTPVATLIVLTVAMASVAAQTPAPKAKAPAAAPAKQAPADTAKAMPVAERTAIQSDLAWLGLYNGLIDGEVSDRMVTAIKTFQKDRGGKQTGVLNPQERTTLASGARTKQTQSGWKISVDPVNGIRLGLPAKLVPQQSSGASGAKWASAQGQIQIETWRDRGAGLTLAAAVEREAKQPNRKVQYRVVKPDFFVLSGLQGLKKFYIRGQIRGSEVRGLTILYDQATEGTMDPLVILMSSAFTPFPAAGAQAGAPPPRKKVEYATGVVIGSEGFILTDRQAVDGCQSIVIAGHGNADRVAEDKDRDLALLRIYGAAGLKPLAFGSGAAKPALTLTGIADPQNQGGGAQVTSVNATAANGGANGETVLTPAPALGFSGAPATDGDGRLAGLTLLRTSIVAGADASVSPQALLVDADQIRNFMSANKVTPSSGAASDPKASVLRVICVRK